MRKTLITASTLCALLATAALAQEKVELSADQAMAPWHHALADTVDMPVAPSSPQLDAATTLTRIAFGSCNDQDRTQEIWAHIAAVHPQAFLFIGDNIYGDTFWDGGADLATLRAAYAKQASHPEFVDFRAKTPMLATWDDHDFGFNDGGGTFAFRRFAEQIFETYWQSPDDVRSRDGVYFSRMYGEEGKKVQLIMLDTRFFRSNLRRPGPGDSPPEFGRFLPQEDGQATMLGDDQWRWLKAELAKPADLRIVVSSIQVLSEAHGWEAWHTMPNERARLLEMLSARAGGGLVMLSGDRHAGGIYRLGDSGDPAAIWEVTSSSLNVSYNSTADATAREPDPLRTSPMIGEENFGLVDIDWDAQELTLTLLGKQGEEHTAQKIAF